MKKIIFILSVFTSICFVIPSCKKDSVAATTYPIQGLWVGTYTNYNGTYFFSFSVYPDGTVSYTSKGPNNTSFFATGTWTLTGATFSFSVIESHTGDSQSGTAVYSNSNGTLSNGVIADATAGTTGTWSMNKIN